MARAASSRNPATPRVVPRRTVWRSGAGPPGGVRCEVWHRPRAEGRRSQRTARRERRFESCANERAGFRRKPALHRDPKHLNCLAFDAARQFNALQHAHGLPFCIASLPLPYPHLQEPGVPNSGDNPVCGPGDRGAGGVDLHRLLLWPGSPLGPPRSRQRGGRLSGAGDRSPKGERVARQSVR